MKYEDLYLIINTAIPLITVFAGLLLLLLACPTSSSLKAYCTARRGIAVAYLIFGGLGFVEVLTNVDAESGTMLFVIAVVTLCIASTQSFLFTYSLLILIDPCHVTKRELWRQVIPISGFVLLAVTSLVFFPDSLKVVFYLFLLFYLFQLVYYTWLFMARYRNYKRNAGDYFSGNEANRLTWVVVAFFSALGIGITVLLLILIPNPTLVMVETVICGVFYAAFLVKYANYPHVFYVLDVILVGTALAEEPVPAPVGKTAFQESIDQWVSSKNYMVPDITITALAMALNTNRSYLSNYINTNEKMNFSSWINFLRIEEGKELLHSQLSIAEIAQELGFADHSSFSRQFKKVTGVSPLEWRKRNG